MVRFTKVASNHSSCLAYASTVTTAGCWSAGNLYFTTNHVVWYSHIRRYRASTGCAVQTMGKDISLNLLWESREYARSEEGEKKREDRESERERKVKRKRKCKRASGKRAPSRYLRIVNKGVAVRKGGTNVLAWVLRGPPVTQSRPGEARHISRGGVLFSLSSCDRLSRYVLLLF